MLKYANTIHFKIKLYNAGNYKKMQVISIHAIYKCTTKYTQYSTCSWKDRVGFAHQYFLWYMEICTVKCLYKSMLISRCMYNFHRKKSKMKSTCWNYQRLQWRRYPESIMKIERIIHATTNRHQTRLWYCSFDENVIEGQGIITW